LESDEEIRQREGAAVGADVYEQSNSTITGGAGVRPEKLQQGLETL
jgi:hypothetical protein